MQMRNVISCLFCFVFFLGMASGSHEPYMSEVLAANQDFTIFAMYAGACFGSLFCVLVYFSSYAIKRLIDIIVNFWDNRNK